MPEEMRVLSGPQAKIHESGLLQQACICQHLDVECNASQYVEPSVCDH